MPPIKQTWHIIQYLYERFFEDGCSYRAASLAYTSLLSLVPLMMISFYILSFFPVFKGTGQMLQGFILKHFIAGSATAIDAALNEFLKNISKLSWMNLLSLCGVSLLLVYNMVRAFNAIWHVEMQRHLALAFIIYLLVLLLSPLIFGVLFLFSSYVASIPLLEGLPFTYILKKPFFIIFPYIAAFIVFTFFNWILPSCKVRLTDAAIAGFVTTIFFEIAKYAFSFYLSYFPTYQLIYGALSTIPIFLIWLYVCWMIILFGAILCNALAVRFRKVHGIVGNRKTS